MGNNIEHCVGKLWFPSMWYKFFCWSSAPQAFHVVWLHVTARISCRLWNNNFLNHFISCCGGYYLSLARLIIIKVKQLPHNESILAKYFTSRGPCQVLHEGRHLHSSTANLFWDHDILQRKGRHILCFSVFWHTFPTILLHLFIYRDCFPDCSHCFY